MNLHKKNSESLIKYRIDQAIESINEVEFLIRNKKFRLAVSRILNQTR